MLDEPEQYRPSRLACWLHKFTHWDLTFTEINSTFAPTDEKYKESLYFFASLPVAWLILTLVIFSVYMCCRCCWCASKSKSRKRSEKTCCLTWAMLILIVICGVLLSLSFYGNEQADEGISTLVSSVQKVNKTIDDIESRVDVLDAIVTNVNDTGMENVVNVIDKRVPNSTVRALVERMVLKLQQHCSSAKDKIDVIKSDTEKIHLNKVVDVTAGAEFLRWILTIVVLCLVVLMCLGFLIGVVKKSRGILMSSVVMGVVSLVLSWVLTGTYFGINMGAADLCVNPDGFILSKTSPEIRPVLKHYMVCEQDPFSDNIASATTGLTDANRTLNLIVKIVEPFHISKMLMGPVTYVRQQLKYGIGNITRLGALVSCSTLQGEYVDALYGLCDKALLGMVFIMLSCCVIGLSVSIMICLASVTWRHYSQKLESYESDDTDPFLPRPPPYNGYGTIPIDSVASLHDNSRVDVRLSNRSSLELSPHAASVLAPGGSPPPAYPHNHLRQYNVMYRRMDSQDAHWNDHQTQPHVALHHPQTHATFNQG